MRDKVYERMNIDIEKLNRELNHAALQAIKTLLPEERAFVRELWELRDECARNAMKEVDAVIKKYSIIQAEKAIELYNKHKGVPA